MAAFVTTLSADVSVSDQIITVAGNSGARTTYPWRLVCEDEVMYVLAGVVVGEVLSVFDNQQVSDGLTWSVVRGADDTDPALHSAGAVVTGVRVGQAATSEALVEDDVTPTDVLIDDDQGDILTSDPTITGV